MSLGRQRFSIIPAGAVTDRRLEPRDLQVLCLLGRHTDNDGWCCRSQVKMARELGCGRATVQRSLGRLADAGYLEHRAAWRESGADAAHEYRVVIDPPDGVSRDQIEPERGGAHLWAGVPTGGQGCPPMDGQGVPTHERAPMLTTPLNEKRERARASAEFEQALKAWPSGFADGREEALTAWEALSPDERAEARAEIGRYVSAGKALGRKHLCSFGRYLAERRWFALPEKPRARETPEGTHAAPAKPPVKARATAFQRAHPELYPELFGEAAGDGDRGATDAAA